MANEGERRVSREVTTAAAADADTSSADDEDDDDDDDDEDDDDDDEEEEEVGEAIDTPAGDSGSVSDKPELPFARGVDSRLPNEAPNDRLPTLTLPLPAPIPLP